MRHNEGRCPIYQGRCPIYQARRWPHDHLSIWVCIVFGVTARLPDLNLELSGERALLFNCRLSSVIACIDTAQWT